MSDKKHSYQPQGFFKTAFALRRMMRDGDYDKADVEDAAIVEITFNRSRWGGKLLVGICWLRMWRKTQLKQPI